MRLGFLGCGTIAAAVVHGLAGRGHDITVSERSEATSTTLVSLYPEVSRAPNQQVIDQSDVIFLGLMAERAGQALQHLRFREGQQVVSFMAGMGLEDLTDLVRPAAAQAVMMPFPGIAQGGSPIMALGDIALLSAIFEPQNRIFPLSDQAELEAYLAAQAVLSPVARLIADAASWLAPQVDDPQAAEAFLRMLVSTSLASSSAETLIEALNTPGGYNQRLRLHMEGCGLRSDLESGLSSLHPGH